MKNKQINLTNLIDQYLLKLIKIVNSCINIDQVDIAYTSVDIAVDTLNKLSRTKVDRSKVSNLNTIMHVFISDKYTELSSTN